MIHTSRQLKALVRNRSRGDSTKAQLLIRSYIMERFLERISLSPYREKFILKGGMLISSMVGVDYRSTMDMDTTVRNMPLSADHMEKIVKDIIRIPIEDGVTFGIKKITEIMEEEEYGGIRLHLEAVLDTMKIPLKLDVSTGDIITPKEITYQYWLMFEERTIPVLAYNLETVLAEKLETVPRRGTANTRLRDFYDLFLLQKNECFFQFSVIMGISVTALEVFNMAFILNPSEQQQLSLFDYYENLTEREKKFLEKSWAKYFSDYIFPKIYEKLYAALYSGKYSRPNTPVNVQVGALLIKELANLSDDELDSSLMFDIRFQYALHTTSFIDQPLSDRTLGRFRARCNAYEEETGIDLLHDTICSLSDEMAKIMEID